MSVQCADSMRCILSAMSVAPFGRAHDILLRYSVVCDHCYKAIGGNDAISKSFRFCRQPPRPACHSSGAIPNPPPSAALNAITGSTIVANGQYGRVVMFIAADHTLDVFQKGQRSQDRWSDKGGQFCIEHESHCAKVMLFGTQGTLDYDGNVFPFTVETGNQVGT